VDRTIAGLGLGVSAGVVGNCSLLGRAGVDQGGRTCAGGRAEFVCHGSLQNDEGRSAGMHRHSLLT